MTRLIVLTAAAICASVTAFAATGALLPDAPEVIEIEVAPAELATCRSELRALDEAQPVSDSGRPLLFGPDETLPEVACVASGI